MKATAFGLPLDVGFPAPGLRTSPELGSAPEVVIRLADAAEAASWWGQPAQASTIWETRFPEGETVTVVQRDDGAQRIVYGRVAVFFVAADTSLVLCAPANEQEPRWLRFLLDTVLWWVASVRGFFLLHATAVAIGGAAVAVAARTSGGKTTLALELLRRGFPLVSDDVVALTSSPRAISAHPATSLLMAPRGSTGLNELGHALATVGDEIWLDVRKVQQSPLPLGAVVLYRREEGRTLSLKRVAATPIDLLPHVWDVRGDSARSRDRFEFLGRLIEEAVIFELDAPLGAPPPSVANLVADAFDCVMRNSGAPEPAP